MIVESEKPDVGTVPVYGPDMQLQGNAELRPMEETQLDTEHAEHLNIVSSRLPYVLWFSLLKDECPSPVPLYGWSLPRWK